MPAGRRGGVILVNPGISGVFLKTGPGTPLFARKVHEVTIFFCIISFISAGRVSGEWVTVRVTESVSYLVSLAHSWLSKSNCSQSQTHSVSASQSQALSLTLSLTESQDHHHSRHQASGSTASAALQQWFQGSTITDYTLSEWRRPTHLAFLIYFFCFGKDSRQSRASFWAIINHLISNVRLNDWKQIPRL